MGSDCFGSVSLHTFYFWYHVFKWGKVFVPYIKLKLTIIRHSDYLVRICFDFKILYPMGCSDPALGPFTCTCIKEIEYIPFTIIVKSLDPLRAKKTFIRKKLGHTMVAAIKASSVTL